jgi:DNA-binding transcriptional regulator/RsmH inhibitor MraZ
VVSAVRAPRDGAAGPGARSEGGEAGAVERSLAGAAVGVEDGEGRCTVTPHIRAHQRFDIRCILMLVRTSG